MDFFFFIKKLPESTSIFFPMIFESLSETVTTSFCPCHHQFGFFAGSFEEKKMNYAYKAGTRWLVLISAHFNQCVCQVLRIVI